MNKLAKQKLFSKLITVFFALFGFFLIWATVVLNNIDGDEKRIELQVARLNAILPLHWIKVSSFLGELPEQYAGNAQRISVALANLQKLPIEEVIKTQQGCDTFSVAFLHYQKELNALWREVKKQPAPPNKWIEFSKETVEISIQIQRLVFLIDSYNLWVQGDTSKIINYLFYNRKPRPIFSVELYPTQLESLPPYNIEKSPKKP